MIIVTTIKDVAAHAGVSHKTVSNVLGGRLGRVGVETERRVRASVATLNYRPNLAARHLRSTHTGVLALAIPDLNNAYFSHIGDAIVTAASAQGYTVLIDYTRGDRAEEALVAHGLRPHLIDGVILSSLMLDADDLRPELVPAPLVLLGERLFDAPYDHVAIDNVAAARLATAHLLDLGRRRVAAIVSAEEAYQDHSATATTRLRLRGYTEALTTAGHAVDPRLVTSAGAFYRLDGARAMRRLLALDRPPDAVFCFNDLVAIGALHALHKAGRRIPDDVAVVGYDNIDEGLFATPSLTTIAPDKDEIGRRAVSLLIERVSGARTGPPVHVDAPFRLLVRTSTAGPGVVEELETERGAPTFERAEHR